MKKITHPWHSLLLLLILVIAASCQKQGTASPSKKEKQFELSGFTKIVAGENFTVSVAKSKLFSIKATGAAEDVDDLGLTVHGSQLNIRYNRLKINRGKIDVVITVPVIEVFQLSAGARGSITGFHDQQSLMNAVLTGASSANLSGTGSRVSIHVSGNSNLSLSGSTEILQGILSGSGQLHAYGLYAREAKVTAAENAKAYVTPSEILFANVSGHGQIFYRGDPSTHLDINENGQVIRE